MKTLESTVSLATLANILANANNNYIRIEWESDHSSRLNKRGMVNGEQVTNPYRGKLITKRYIATCRNNFKFNNSVKNQCARMGKPKPSYQCGPRTWGKHVNFTPFVIHNNETEGIRRLHLHLLPSLYFETSTTGYYVNGKKVSLDKIMPFVKTRKEPKTVLDQARRDNHPVNARLDDVIRVKVGGKYYKVSQPDTEDIEALATEALNRSKQLAMQRAS